MSWLDFPFAELNQRVNVLFFSTGQRVCRRQLRLPSSLLEDDFIDPYMIAQDATYEMRRSEAMRMAAAHWCVVAARRAMSTASHRRRLEATAVTFHIAIMERVLHHIDAWKSSFLALVPSPERRKGFRFR